MSVENTYFECCVCKIVFKITHIPAEYTMDNDSINCPVCGCLAYDDVEIMDGYGKDKDTRKAD